MVGERRGRHQRHAAQCGEPGQALAARRGRALQRQAAADDVAQQPKQLHAQPGLVHGMQAEQHPQRGAAGQQQGVERGGADAPAALQRPRRAAQHGEPAQHEAGDAERDQGEVEVLEGGVVVHGGHGAVRGTGGGGAAEAVSRFSELDA